MFRMHSNQIVMANTHDLNKDKLYEWGLETLTGVVGKCVSKENPKSDLNLDFGFVDTEANAIIN